MRFFFFGTLADADLLALVIGRPRPGSPVSARLADHRLATVRGETFPMLVPASGAWVPGVVIEGFDEADYDRILFFESIDYAPRDVSVVLGPSETVPAIAFIATDAIADDGRPWDGDLWRRQDKAACLRETALWMALYGYVDATEAERLWDAAVAEGRPLEDLVRAARGLDKAHDR